MTKRILSEEHKRNISISKMGKIPWNKGLTKDIDIRLHKMSLKKLGVKRNKCFSYASENKICGDKNPAKRLEVREKLRQRAKERVTHNIFIGHLKGGAKTASIRIGKTYEEIYGIEKANAIKCKLSLCQSGINGGFYGKKHSENTKNILRIKSYNRKQKYYDTKPELILQNILVDNSIIFQKNVKLYGAPDIFVQPNICIFVDGEYWHNYPHLRDRDLQVNKILKNKGYVVLRFWAKDICSNREHIAVSILKKIAIASIKEIC
jgi:G:T-mismatch repair DNA endonuclease (very short patch repair protein)